MKKCRLKAGFWGIFLSLIFITHLAHADIFMKQKQHTDPVMIMGQQEPAEDIIDTIWITRGKIRTDNDQRTAFTFLDQKKIYIFDHQLKTYNEISLEPQQMNQTDPQSAMAMQMMQGMAQQMEFSISPTSETKMINNWNCKKYVQEMKMMMGPITTIIWATEDIKVDTVLFDDFYASAMMAMPGAAASAEKIRKEMQKIKGMHVFTETITFMMNTQIRSTTELLEYKEQKAPAGIYDLPTGYQKVSQMPY